jgi:hypothetical protein
MCGDSASAAISYLQLIELRTRPKNS